MPKGKLKPEDEQTIRENYFLLREELDAKDLVEFLCSGDGFQLFMTSIEKHFKNLHSRLQDIAKQKIWSANQIKKAKEFEQEKEQYDKEKAEWIDRLQQLQETNSVQLRKIEDQDAKIQLLTDENTKLKEEIEKYKEKEQAKSHEEEIQKVIFNASRKETNISVKDTILKGLQEEREKILKSFWETSFGRNLSLNQGFYFCTEKQIPPDDRIALLEKRLHRLISVRPVKKSVAFDFDTDAMPSDSSKIYLFQEDEPLSIHAANSLLKEAHVLRELTLARENRNFALEQKLEKKDVLKDVLEKEIGVLIYEIEKLSARFRETTENFLKEKKSLEGKLLAEENKHIMISKDLENKKNELQERLKESSELIQQI
ncbi:structural maintenance of chromosomes protein 2, partial [Biomphalaria pfeifferi]